MIQTESRDSLRHPSALASSICSLCALIASGAASLIFEIVWIRSLSLSLGSGILSLSLVSSTFFLGMATGARLCAWLLARLNRPLLAYALLESAIGLYALVSLDLIEQTSVVYAWTGAGSPILTLVLKATMALATLFPPAVAMGMTLPLIVAATRSKSRVGLQTAVLYTANTGGAVLGTLAVGLFLISAWGHDGAIWTGSALEFLAAALAITASFTTRETGPQPHRRPSGSPGWVLLALAALAGMTGMALEIVFARVLNVVLMGTIETVSVVLATFLSGIAIGSGAYRWLGKRRPTLLTVALIMLATVVVVLMTTMLLEPLAYLGSVLGDHGGPSVAPLRFLAACAVLVLPAALNGALFPATVDLATSQDQDRGGLVGRLLSANTLGSVFGAFITGVFLLPRFGSTFVLFAALSCLLLASLACSYRAGSRPVAAVALLLFAIATTLWPGVDMARLAQLRSVRGASYTQTSVKLDEAEARWIYATEGAYGVVVLTESPPGDWQLFIDGLRQSGRRLATPRFTLESVLLGSIPAALARGQERALVIGLGSGVTTEALVAAGISRVDVVELEPRVAEALQLITDGTPPITNHPGVQLIIDDGREFLNRRRDTAPPYDVIASQPSHWWLSGVGSLATREFYARVFAQLADGGVYFQWINGQRMTAEVMRGLVGSMSEVFDETLVFALDEEGLYYLAGIRGTPHNDRDEIARRLGRQELQDLTSDHPRSLDDLLSWVIYSGSPLGPAPSNHDRDALVETRLARISFGPPLDLVTLSPALLDHAGAPVALLPDATPARAGFAVEAAERRLQTSGGYPMDLRGFIEEAPILSPYRRALAAHAAQLAQLYADDCWAMYLTARLTVADDRTERASRDVLAAVCPERRHHPARQRALYYAALLDLYSGRCEQGEQTLQDAVSATTSHHHLRGLLQECLGRDPSTSYQAALLETPHPLPGAALNWASRQNLPIPPGALQIALRGHLDLESLQTVLGQNTRSGNPGSSARLAATYASRVEERLQHLLKRAATLARRGQHQQALVLYRRALELRPDHPGAAIAALAFLRSRGFLAEANAVRAHFIAAVDHPDTARRLLEIAEQ